MTSQHQSNDGKEDLRRVLQQTPEPTTEVPVEVVEGGQVSGVWSTKEGEGEAMKYEDCMDESRESFIDAMIDQAVERERKTMKVLVACEFSGIVRDAFKARGHDAWSCDIEPTETPGNHIQGDVFELAIDGCQHGLHPWDLLIAFPPCTHLCVSGARWFKDKQQEQYEAKKFFMALASAPIPKIAIENPIGVMSSTWRKPDQIIQPWQFGHGETKATCLWLKNLPKLVSTNVVEGRHARVHREPPGPNRWKNRSRTYQGIAKAMAEQWG